MARSRDELEKIIERGEVVILADGRVAKTKDDLPSAVELAGDDIVKKAHAVGDLIAQRAALDEQIAAAGEVPPVKDDSAPKDPPADSAPPENKDTAKK